MLLRENIPVKYIVGKISREIILITVYVSAVVIVHENFRAMRISIPLGVPTILGTVISLLLAFKSNQAYDRWWEARTLWGAIVNDSRSFSRQVRSFMDNIYGSDEVEELKKVLVRRQIAWCYSLGQSLRKQNPLGGLERLLPEADLHYLKNFHNVPYAILDLQGRDIARAAKNGWINDFQQVAMDEMLSRFSTSMGACERIKTTIFPVTYSLYIHFSLMLFIMLLPFGLIQFFSFMVVPFTIAIASSFLLIEKMAIHLQDPFENRPTDTPVTTIAQKIERDLKQMLEERSAPDEALLKQIAGKKPYYVL